MRKIATMFYTILAVVSVMIFMSSCMGSGHVSHRPYKHGYHSGHYYDPRYQIYQRHRTW